MRKLFILLMLLSVNFVYADLTLVDDSRNVISTALEGRWTVDSPLSTRLMGRAEELQPRLTMSFTKDPGVLREIHAREVGRTLNEQAYSVGRVDVAAEGEGADSQYYALINHDGNPTLALFDPNARSGRGDWEFAIIMLAKAREAGNDLLFVGGDRRTEPMFALRRAE